MRQLVPMPIIIECHKEDLRKHAELKSFPTLYRLYNSHCVNNAIWHVPLSHRCAPAFTTHSTLCYRELEDKCTVACDIVSWNDFLNIRSARTVCSGGYFTQTVYLIWNFKAMSTVKQGMGLEHFCSQLQAKITSCCCYALHNSQNTKIMQFWVFYGQFGQRGG